ncbi:MAG: hypothetical protein Q8Q65_01905 [bacterium]|nr:hypothetical protein [bacterium]
MAEVKTYRVISTKNASGCEYVEPYTFPEHRAGELARQTEWILANADDHPNASWLTATGIEERGRSYSLIATSAELTEDGWLRPAPTEQTK